MSFVKSNRGKDKLVYNNHVYVFSKKSSDGENSIWVCEKRSVCKGRVWTKGDSPVVVKIVQEHLHPAEATRSEALRVLHSIKEKAKSTQESTQQILATAVSGVHTNVSATLPRKDSIKRSIRMSRQIAGIPVLPQNAQELVIPEEYKQIIVDGVPQPFLLYDSEDQVPNNRMLLFATRENLSNLLTAEEWYVDGTFSTAPNIFSQLYTIHVKVNDTVLPAVYALLTNKTKQTYLRLLQKLKQLQPGLQPRTIMADFELASIHAFKEEFPGVNVTACFFHFCQSIWRRIQSVGLQVQYQENHEFAMWLRMLPALAFVPPCEVESSFDILIDGGFPEEALQIVDYFEDNYIGRRNRRQGRRAAPFPIPLWNVFDRTLQNGNRTNNHVEGWHRGFVASCGSLHPNIFKFINMLKKEQAVVNYSMSQIRAGNMFITKNKKYAAIGTRLQLLASQFKDKGRLDYLKGIAHNYNF